VKRVRKRQGACAQGVARGVGRESKTHRERREFLKFVWVSSNCDQLLVEQVTIQISKYKLVKIYSFE
jgi:hypothetical protein